MIHYKKVSILISILFLLDACSTGSLSSHSNNSNDSTRANYLVQDTKGKKTTYTPIQLEYSYVSARSTYKVFPYHSYNFSQDEKLLALFQHHSDSLATIKIWDTQTGKLKYSTKIKAFSVAGNYSQPIFSPDNQMIVIEGDTRFYTWEYSKTRKVYPSCSGYMGGGVDAFAKNNHQLFLIKTVDSVFSICHAKKKDALITYNTNKSAEKAKMNALTHSKKALANYGIQGLIWKKKVNREEKTHFIHKQVNGKDVGFDTHFTAYGGGLSLSKRLLVRLYNQHLVLWKKK